MPDGTGDKDSNCEDPAGSAETLVATDAAPDGARAPHLALARPKKKKK
eukprot:COSAG04_NODE_3593_length_2684_cov_2.480077_4_plen_48_part_00